ncbi:MAG: hypothetical protein ABII01_06560 [Candidatus Woesearchaeota archaeon]
MANRLFQAVKLDDSYFSLFPGKERPKIRDGQIKWVKPSVLVTFGTGYNVWEHNKGDILNFAVMNGYFLNGDKTPYSNDMDIIPSQVVLRDSDKAIVLRSLKQPPVVKDYRVQQILEQLNTFDNNGLSFLNLTDMVHDMYPARLEARQIIPPNIPISIPNIQEAMRGLIESAGNYDKALKDVDLDAIMRSMPLDVFGKPFREHDNFYLVVTQDSLPHREVEPIFRQIDEHDPLRGIRFRSNDDIDQGRIKSGYRLIYLPFVVSCVEEEGEEMPSPDNIVLFADTMEFREGYAREIEKFLVLSQRPEDVTDILRSRVIHDIYSLYGQNGVWYKQGIQLMQKINGDHIEVEGCVPREFDYTSGLGLKCMRGRRFEEVVGTYVFSERCSGGQYFKDWNELMNFEKEVTKGLGMHVFIDLFKHLVEEKGRELMNQNATPVNAVLLSNIGRNMNQIQDTVLDEMEFNMAATYLR